jgi:subtilisin family serine protease
MKRLKIKTLRQAIALGLLLGISGQTLAQLPSTQSQEFLEQYGLRTINVYPAWESATGTGVVVASLDTGVNANHVDLVGQLADGGNYADVDNAGGHGSTIAGLIASSFNGTAIIGVAYNSRVLPIQVANSDRFADPGAAANGFNQAAGRADVGIISFSVGTIFSEPLNSSIISAMGAGKTVFIRAGWSHQELI